MRPGSTRFLLVICLALIVNLPLPAWSRVETAQTKQTLAYGSDPLQALDLWLAREARAPLVVFVHGGGWKRGDKDNATGRHKAPHYTGQGYAFASINYRLVPTVRVEGQAADVAAALKYLIDRAPEFGIDPGRVVLMGHSAGAHLVALVGTDPAYLRAAGLAPEAVRGVIAIDGAAYDVPGQMASGPRLMQGTYTEAFGTDPARQRALSPVWQADEPNVAEFLLLYVQREDGIEQARALGAALERGGSRVEHGRFPGRGLLGHMEINRRLGETGFPATRRVDDWLNRIFGEPAPGP
ncbi:MAG: alpha/beta hydrolase [Thiobacillus sp.]|nr:alpha/beta hydrolase [Thiobacillus sp.]